jgi:folate-dependent phosphoribosylglycinamide formyltransferase PurN
MKKILFLSSPKGTIVREFYERNLDYSEGFEISCIFTSRVENPIVRWSQERGIPCFGGMSDSDITSVLPMVNFDVAVLTGWRRLVRQPLLRAIQGRAINIHPSLLPKYRGLYGIDIHKEVLKNKEDVSGITIHYIDEHFDTGPVIKQMTIRVLPDDTPESLCGRIKFAEASFLMEVLKSL